MKDSENKAKIKEIFSSIQGEGPFIGCKQIFIRFCACNLNCCYCDTDFYPTDIGDKTSFFDFTPQELTKYLEENYDIASTHSISFTGGEPLIWADFLQEFLPYFKKRHNIKYYLETNGTIADNVTVVMPYTDIIAADIKLPSCSGINNSFELHNKFFKSVSEGTDVNNQTFTRKNGNLFAKVVFDEGITDEEIKETIKLSEKYDFEIILQPKMIGNSLSVSTDFMINIFEKFVSKYKPTRLIPQVHKFINVE